jgi:hypothetical protein
MKGHVSCVKKPTVNKIQPRTTTRDTPPRRRRYRLYPKREELQRSMPDLLSSSEVDELFSRTQYRHYKSTNDIYANMRNYEDTMPGLASADTSSSSYSDEHHHDQQQPQQNVIEVSPGLFLTLRTSQETIQAFTTGTAVKIKCLLCPLQLYCVPDCEMVLCPDCRILVPLEQPHPQSYGVGLGLK